MKEYIVQNDIDNPTNSRGYMFGRTISQLIRCKDCKWYKTNYSWNGKEHRVCVIEPYEPARKADDFCSRAERKDNG